MPEVRTETLIDAPPADVWEVLGDLGQWGDWNPLIPRIQAELRPGAPVSFRIRLGGRALPIRARMVRADPGRELCWRGPRSRLAGLLMSGEHYFRLEPADGGRTLFRHGEVFTGVLTAALFRRLGPVLTLSYEEMNHALKRRVEGR